MEWIRLTSINDTYFNEAWDIYTTSFPIFEQRLLENQKEAMLHPNFYFTAITEDNHVVAIIGYWMWDNFLYVEHLAVHANMRGRQIGTTILTHLATNHKRMILEIDPPIDDISIRRLHFYEKVGFKLNDFDYTHPAYQKDYHPHSLKVLSYQHPLSNEELQSFKTYLTETIMQFAQK